MEKLLYYLSFWQYTAPETQPLVQEKETVSEPKTDLVHSLKPTSVSADSAVAGFHNELVNSSHFSKPLPSVMPAEYTVIHEPDCIDKLAQDPNAEVPRIVESRDLNALKQICRREPSLLVNPKICNEDDEILLAVMVNKKWIEGINYVLNQEGIVGVIDSINNSDYQPLNMLTKMLNYEPDNEDLIALIDRLLDLGVDPDGYSGKAFESKKVLDRAGRKEPLGEKEDSVELKEAEKYLFNISKNKHGQILRWSFRPRATTPLVNLCQNIHKQHIPLIKKLIENGASVNTSKIGKNHPNAFADVLRWLHDTAAKCDKVEGVHDDLDGVFEVIELLLEANAKFDPDCEVQAFPVERFKLNRWDEIKSKYDLKYSQKSTCEGHESIPFTGSDGHNYYNIKVKKQSS